MSIKVKSVGDGTSLNNLWYTSCSHFQISILILPKLSASSFIYLHPPTLFQLPSSISSQSVIPAWPFSQYA